ncbi:MAG: TIGR01212 family radical SAM protein [Flavobacteriales bacterium]|nr:TIGR01212 family radical SAM protein [Flavobacteriales bacterium]
MARTIRYQQPSAFWAKTFPFKVQKVSLDTGFTCPNRDGTKGYGGCTYCNNDSFNPSYCGPDKSISTQLHEGIAFFARKYSKMKYLAYFQAYTNSYSDDETVINYYQQAIDHPDIVGLVVGTRPDCVSDRVLDFLEESARHRFTSLEFGVESTLDRTLEIINRCHTFDETRQAYARAANRGIHLGAHMILGLPGESIEDLIAHADRLNELPIQSVKLHHLQIIRRTIMAKQFADNPDFIIHFTPESYADMVVSFLERLRPDIIVERFIAQAPPDLLIAPQWGGVRNYEMVSIIEKKLEERDTCQGRLHQNILQTS